MLRIVTVLVILLGAICLRAETPPRVIFDTDMGSDCDDVGALALLHSYADEGAVEIVACIFSSSKVPYGAGIIDAINVYYGRPDIPIGACHDLSFGDPVDKMSAEKLAKDQAAFGNRIVHNHDAEEQVKLLRRLLVAEPDRVIYVTVGHTKALHDLLRSEPDEISPLAGPELILKKVKSWVALGALRSANFEGNWTQDWNFFRNETADYTDYLVDHLPVPMVFIDAGSKVMTGKSLAQTPSGNIVRTAYRDWLWWHEQRVLSDQRPSWDLAAVHYAVKGSGEFLEVPRIGELHFDPNKGCRWQDGERYRNHFLVQENEGIGDAFADYLNERIARPPAKR